MTDELAENEEYKYPIDQLCKLTGFTKRTIRYYIQQELVDKPYGEKRGSFYTNSHLGQLLEIKKWQKAGVSLERIKEITNAEIDSLARPPEKGPQAGDISVWSRVLIDKGIELQIDAKLARMTPEDLRSFILNVTNLYEASKESNDLKN